MFPVGRQLGGRVEFVGAGAADEPALGTPGAAGQRRHFDDIPGQGAVFVGVVGGGLAAGAEPRRRPLALPPGAAQIAAGVGFPNLVDFQRRAAVAGFPQTQDAFVRPLPEAGGRDGFVGVMPNQPALLIDGKLRRHPRQDFGKAVDVDEAARRQQRETIGYPAARPFDVVAHRQQILIVAEILADVIRRVGDDDVESCARLPQGRQHGGQIAGDYAVGRRHFVNQQAIRLGRRSGGGMGAIYAVTRRTAIGGGQRRRPQLAVQPGHIGTAAGFRDVAVGDSHTISLRWAGGGSANRAAYRWLPFYALVAGSGSPRCQYPKVVVIPVGG